MVTVPDPPPPPPGSGLTPGKGGESTTYEQLGRCQQVSWFDVERAACAFTVMEDGKVAICIYPVDEDQQPVPGQMMGFAPIPREQFVPWLESALAWAKTW